MHHFDLGGEMVWIPDPDRGQWLPFVLSAHLSRKLRSRQAGESGSAMSSEERLSLAMAGVLVPENFAAMRRRNWQDCVSRLRAQFQLRGYAPIRSPLHPFQVAELRNYYRQRIRAGGLWLGDTQSPKRYVAHNESVARFFHHQLTGAVAAIAGVPVKPSYVYIASYQQGASLAKHTDREQCEFSVTFCLDYAPEPEEATPWPICLQTSTETVSVYQALGDGLLYRGRQLPHFRDTLPPGHTSTSIFFHYVHQDFNGPLD